MTEKSMAKKKTKVKKARKGEKRSLSIADKVLILSFLITAVTFYPSTLILVFGALPTIAAYVSCPSGSRKLAAITVGMLNLCGVVFILAHLWMGGASFEYSQRLLLDPVNWLIMYAPAALGWGVWFGIPSAYAYVSVAAARTRLEYLRKQRHELIDEWGADLNRIEVERREAHEAVAQAKASSEQAAQMGKTRSPVMSRPAASAA